MNLRSVWTVVMASIVSLLLIHGRPAIAGEWRFKPSLNGSPHIWEYHHSESDYSHLKNSAPAKPHARDVSYSIILCNRTKLNIGYALNGQNEPRIKPGESYKWIIMGSKENPPEFNISYNNGRINASIKIEENCTYDFQDIGSIIVLYKRSLVSFKSYNVRDFFVRHRNLLGEISGVNNDFDRKDSTFNIIPGFADSDLVSIQSANIPEKYFRHQELRLKLCEYENTDIFRNDSTFRRVKGLSKNTCVSFESLNMPGHYIRHKNLLLFVEKNDGTVQFSDDATFFPEKPLYIP